MLSLGLYEIAIVAVTIALPIWVLFKIRSRGLRGIEAALWVVAVVFVPVLGSVAFLSIRPGRQTSQS